MDPLKIQRFKEQAMAQGASPEEVDAFIMEKTGGANFPSNSSPVSAPTDDGFKLTDLIPIAGGVIGGAAGSVIAPGVGTIAGGGLGSAAGEAIRQMIEGEDADVKKIALEGGMGLAGGVAGKVIGKGVSLAAKAAGKSLEEGGSNLALKALRPSKTQLTKFNQQHGEDMARVLTRNNLVGKSANEIEEQAIKPLQDSFDEIVKKSGLKIDQSKIDRKFTEAINKLQESPSTTDNKLADDLAAEYNNILAKAGDGPMDIGTLHKFRQVFDSKVKDFAADPIQAGKNRLIGNILRQTIQESADEAGLTGAGGRSLKNLGLELSKLYGVRDIAELQGNLGRGNLPVGLLTLLGLGGGAEVGGALGGPVGRVVGAGATIAGTKIMNSPKTIALMTKMGQNLGAGGGVGMGLTSQVAGQSATRAIGNLTGLTEPGVQSDPQGEAYNYNNDPYHAGNITQAQEGVKLAMADTSPDLPMGESEQPAQPAKPASITGYTTDQLGAAYSAALMAGDTKAASQLKALYDFEVEHQTNAGGGDSLELSDTAIKTVTDLQGAVSDIEGLTKSIQGSDLTGPVSGLRAMNPYDVDARSLQAEIDRVRQVVGKALEGGVLRKEDEEKYKKILPTMTDTKAVAINKLIKLHQKIQDDLELYSTTQQFHGKGRTSENMQAAEQALSY